MLPENDAASLKINQLEWLIQTDAGLRGIHRNPGDNLCTFTRGHLLKAIQFLAQRPGCSVAIATGFYIPAGTPPAPESDGPLGALFLARSLHQLGYQVMLITDALCAPPLHQGLEFFGIQAIDVIRFPVIPANDNARHARALDGVQCLISLERVGPCHTPDSFSTQYPVRNEALLARFEKEGPGELAGLSLNMRGKSVSAFTAPIHVLFEEAPQPIFTVGIGDGGNEIGMGAIPWHIISDNIQNGLGGKIACRIPTDATIVAGVSNWAGYAIAAGVFARLTGGREFAKFYDASQETKLLEEFCRTKSVVDGVKGIPALSVDGLKWDLHLNIMGLVASLIAA
ncbi:MAG: glutamate cyclase domain-containing protein [Candidatus Zhuqueibacterota bacterium]